MLILSCDYDDTLYIDETIDKKDIKKIEEFQAAGNLFGINSGRHLDSVFEECEKFNLTCDFYIGNNGTVVLDRNRQLVFINDFDIELVEDILAYFRSHLRDKVYFISVNNGYQFGREFFSEGSDFLPEHKDALDEYLSQPISTMFSQVIDRNDTMEIVGELNEAFKDRAYFYGNAPFIDIVSQPLDKATGLQEIATYYEVDHDKCFAIGDSYNDISTFKSFYSFVMANSKDSVKAFANEEVKSVREAIERIMTRDE